MNNATPLSRVIEPATVSHPQVLVVEPTTEERAAIAQLFRLVELKSLRAELEIAAGPRGEVGATGRIVADYVQTCVVTLVPLDQHMDEAFDRRFVPAGAPADAEAIVASVDDDPPDIYRPEDGIDIGAAVLEAFVLAVDPYPRAPGAELPNEYAPHADASESPFAVLKSFGHRSE